MSPLPTLIISHGAWHDPSCFDKVTTRLVGLGYKCLFPERPGIGPLAATKTPADDAAVFRAAVESCLDLGESVIVVAHSNAGFVVPSALEGLSRASRARAGQAGGVICMALITAFIAPVGDGMFEGVTGRGNVQRVVTSTTFMPGNDLHDLFYNDLPRAEADLWIARLRPTHYPPLPGTTYEGWRDVPVYYLLCELDRCIPADLQEAMVAGARREGARITVERIQASHSPFLSQPQKVVDWIRGMVEKEMEMK